RGLTADRMHFLTALPRIDGTSTTDDVADAASVLAESLDLPTAPRAPLVRLLPTQLTVAELPRPVAAAPELDFTMALGIEDGALGPQWHDFDTNPHLLIFGDTETGKTNLLRHIAGAVAQHYSPDEGRVMFVDFRRELHDSVPLDHQINYTVSTDGLTESIREVAELLQTRVPGADIPPDRLRKRDWWTGGRLFILIDDFELAETGGYEDPMQPLLPLLPHGADIGLHLIIARSTANAGRGMMSPLMRKLWELGTAVTMFSCPKDEGVFIGNVRPKTLPPGRAQFVNRRRTINLVQTPIVPK
ncbi:MAG: segregation ATPase FtsK/SpoIIIE, family, partial [Pseudonocardiales bacterium]|nr:segregation ATPase FtsK/SpoIIIE, family [Pseudonocardiales bacterium]